MIYMALLALLAFAPHAQATTFWEETYENHLYPNWIDGDGCITVSTPDGSCYPSISTARAFAGTHSLYMHYQPYMTQDGTYEDRSHTSSTEVWTRFYLRHENFVYPDPSIGQYSKLFFNKADAGSWIIWGMDESSGDLDVAINTDSNINCHTYGSISGSTADTACTFPPNIQSVPLANGQWWCIETHVKANSGGGAQNGVLEVYINGTLTMQKTNLPLYTGSVSPYNTITVYAQTGQGDRYYDNFAVGNTRFNDCGGGGGGGSPAGGGLDF